MKNLILSIDQGTTGTTVIIIDENINVLSVATKPLNHYCTSPGFIEQNPDEIWQSVLEAIAEAVAKARINTKRIAAIGLTNQRETSLIWDNNTKNTLHNALVWQSTGTAPICEKLKARGLEPLIHEKTGLILNPYFSASKYRYLLDKLQLQKQAENKKITLATVDTFLLWMLTDKRVTSTDASNASRTSLMNLDTLQWDNELLEIFNIPKAALPSITSNAAILGHTGNVPGLPDNIPITAAAGDQQAALFGHAAFNEGEAKCTFGTGSFLLVNTGEKIPHSKHGLIATLAWKINNTKKYAIEGSTFTAGSLVQWLRDNLQIIKNTEEIEPLAQATPDSGGVVFVPALSGLGSPHWDPDAKAIISGITHATDKRHIARAALEGIAHQNTDIIDAIQKDTKTKLKNLKVDGGASNNNLLMQIQADLIQTELIRPEITQSTALGAALMAGIGIGLFKNQQDIIKAQKINATFHPAINEQKHRQMRNSWLEALQHTK